jgi:energy-coupling factor transporter ATP-binding protein EcfA2
MPHKVGLAAKELSCQRGGRLVFRGVSFSLAPGEALLVTGPNGAGKTSLLRQIAGLLPLAGGTLRVEDAEPDAQLPELCHYVGHLNAVKANLSVKENLAFWAEYFEAPAAKLGRALDASGRCSCRAALRRAEAAAGSLSPVREPAPDLAARRAASLARRRLDQAARRRDRRSPRARRHRRGRESCEGEDQIRA